MSQRINRLLETVQTDKYWLCAEKARLITESYQQTEGEAQVIRNAKAFANILNKIDIFIEDGELIVGNTASKPMGLEVDTDGGIWTKEEIDGLRADGFTVTKEDEAQIGLLNEYWKTRAVTNRSAQLYDDERLWPFAQSGVLLPPMAKREEGRGGGRAASGMVFTPGLGSVDWVAVLNGGLNKIIEEAEGELKHTRFTGAESVKKIYYLQSIIIANKAIIGFANRFAVLAKEMAAKEKDPVRKKELRRIAEICQQVPAKSARGFYEAIQSFWFIFLMLAIGATPIGRFDQLMYPFYKKDKEAGKITDDEVLELLQCFRIKDMQINFTGSRAHREKWSGMAKWHNMVIGGVTDDGKDATNELSFLILEAAKRCPTPHHTITVRVHDGTPEALMLKALEVVKTGIGMPAFVGDKSYIEYLLSKDVPLNLARNYSITGCIDANISQACITLYRMFVVPLVFDIFMHNGIEPRTGKQLGPETGNLEGFKSFEDLMKGFEKQLAHFMHLNAELINIDLPLNNYFSPGSLASSLMVDGVKEGNAFERTFPYKLGATINAIGMINVADSMAAIKKLVFDEKKVTTKELKAALDANWKDYEEIRKMCLAVPKYGNDDDYVDLIAKELYQFYADTAVTLDSARIGWAKYNPAAISISAQWPGGTITGATPDGRYAGDCLTDGTMSPMRGRDTHGPTAVIKSAAKIDQVPYQATLLNMKFHPTALKGTGDLRRLSDLIKTYFGLGGKHIQFNVVDRATLVDAQKHPENYRDLVVRVAGYSAYFVQLGKVVQDEIIGRTEHDI